MGEIIARNMLIWLKLLIIKFLLLHLVGCLYYCNWCICWLDVKNKFYCVVCAKICLSTFPHLVMSFFLKTQASCNKIHSQLIQNQLWLFLFAHGAPVCWLFDVDDNFNHGAVSSFRPQSSFQEGLFHVKVGHNYRRYLKLVGEIPGLPRRKWINQKVNLMRIGPCIILIFE